MAAERTLGILALVTDAFGGTGGIAQYSRDLAEALAADPSVSNVTVVPRVISRAIPDLPSRVRQVTDSAKSKISYVRAVIAIASSGDFHLVVCGHINLLPLAALAALLTRSPLVLVIYGAEVWESRNYLYRRLVSRTAALITISRFTQSRMATWAPTPEAQIFVIPNAVDLSVYKPEQRSAELANRLRLHGSPILLTLGRMDADEKAKGFDQILEALPSLILQFPNLIYCAAGDGSDRGRLQQKAQMLGVESRVVFTGYIDEADKPGLFRLADAYVMPSRLEGFGYVFLEALASGVPVVASSIDGGKEAVMNGKWGAIVDPDDRDALISAISRTVKEPYVPAPEELGYFSKASFNKRVQSMLGSLLLSD